MTDNRFSQASGSPPKFEYIQTYLIEEESRDGLELVGSYGYLDPTGALVIVRYDWRSKQTRFQLLIIHSNKFNRSNVLVNFVHHWI